MKTAIALFLSIAGILVSALALFRSDEGRSLIPESGATIAASKPQVSANPVNYTKGCIDGVLYFLDEPFRAPLTPVLKRDALGAITHVRCE